MFNVTGGEMIVIILAALVVLGPEKLPDMLRRAGRLYGELRRMSDGFQQELRNTLEEPTRELRETAEMAKASFTGLVDTAKGVVNPTATITTTEHVDPAPDTELVPDVASAPEPGASSAPPGESAGETAAPVAPTPFGEGQRWSAHPVEPVPAQPVPVLAAPLPPPGRVALVAPPVVPAPLPPPAAPLAPPSPVVATNGDHA